jgi:Tol biopolymer transport system component
MKQDRPLLLLGSILFIITACNSLSSILSPNSIEATVPPQTYQPSPPAGVVSVEPTQISTPVFAPTSISKTTATFTPTPMMTPSPAPTPFGGGTGKIAFIADVAIYMMNVDGSDLTRLTDDLSTACFAWSPDGQKIVFQGFSYDVYMLNMADESQPKLIVDVTPTNGDASFSCPIWSPDGHKLIVTTAFYPFGVYLVGVDGSLTAWSDGWGDAWSPDGQRIAFSTSHNDEAEIGIMNADGSGQVMLTDNTAADWDPAWSPDGRTIAFVSNREVKDIYEIYLMNADGSHQRKLTQTPGGAPMWSPDSRYIAYAAVHVGDNEENPRNYLIYIINADAAGQRPLNKVFGTGAAWSPDSQHLVFKRKNVYMIDVDGSHLTRLSIPPHLSGRAYNFAWQPSPSVIHGVDTIPAPPLLLTPISTPEPTPTNMPVASLTPIPIPPSLEPFIILDNNGHPIVLSLSGNKYPLMKSAKNLTEYPQIEQPPQIWELTTLQQLDLSNTQLSQLPPEIGQLTQLQELSLSSNQLSQLPPEIGQLTNLQWLDLSYNLQLSQLPPEIGQLTNLQYLDLSYAPLSQLPPEIGQLKSLQYRIRYD